MHRSAILLLAAALAGCSDFSVRTNLSEQVSGDFRYWCGDGPCRGPRAELAVGYDWVVSDALLVRYEVRHFSFVADNDRGEERAGIQVEWRPWGGR